MATSHPIEPFPADIDRISFGHWLSGFTDGEGCFMLKTWCSAKQVSRGALFVIGLRIDDRRILDMIRSYWQCGTIYLRNPKRISKPSCYYHVLAAQELRNIVIPHFETYPLRAKKSRDFEVWRQGVELLHRMSQKAGKAKNRKWTREEHAEFLSLCDELRHVRQFNYTPFGRQNEPKNQTPCFNWK